MQVAETGIQQELLARLGPDRVTDCLDASGQAVKDATDVATLGEKSRDDILKLLGGISSFIGGIESMAW